MARSPGPVAALDRLARSRPPVDRLRLVIFVTSSIALIGWGFLKPDAEGIGTQNIVLFVINLIGVYRYLIRKQAP